MRTTCDSWAPHLRESDSVIVSDLGFKLGWSVFMVLVAPVWYPLEGSIGIFIGLVLSNSFGTWEESLVGVSLGTLIGLMIFTGKVYFVGLSLGLPLGLPLGYTNIEAVLSGTLLGATIGFWVLYEAVSY